LGAPGASRRRQPGRNRPEGTTTCRRRPEAAGRPHARRKGPTARGRGRSDARSDAARRAAVGGRCDSVAGSAAGSLTQFLAGGPPAAAGSRREPAPPKIFAGYDAGSRRFPCAGSAVEPSHTTSAQHCPLSARSWSRFARVRRFASAGGAAGQQQCASGACYAVAWRLGRRWQLAVGSWRPARAAAAKVASTPRLRTHTTGVVRQRGHSRCATASRGCSSSSSRGGLLRAASARRATPRYRGARVWAAARRSVRGARWV